MPQQLIYTSAARGLVAGRFGYCTVARSATMREAVMLRLEQLSYYHHLSLTGGQERPILAYRVIDIRGSRFHVLSRIQDADLDFTGRTNFIAHHLVVSPEEIRQLPTPALILRDWSGWLTSWNQEPQQLSNETWGNLNSLAGASSLPAQTWQRLTGDAANGYSLLEVKPGTCLGADGVDEKDILSLITESVELLELRDTRRDYKSAAWQYTLTTSMQEQDNPGDFRWRFIHQDNPAFAKFAGTACSTLSSLRAAQVSPEEQAFARKGWQAPAFVEISLNRASIVEGDSVRMEAKADGIPYPSFRWFEVEHDGPVELVGRSGPVVQEQPMGRAKRYAVQALNRAGHKDSRTVELTISSRARLGSREAMLVQPKAEGRRPGHVKTAEEIDKQRRRNEARQAERMFHWKRRRKITFITGFVLVAGAALLVLKIMRGGLGSPNQDTRGGHPGSTQGQPNGAPGTSAPPTPQEDLDKQKVTGKSPHPMSEGAFPAPPEPWLPVVVGQAEPRTRALFINPGFRLTGAGQGLDEKTDGFFFLRQSVSNSVPFSARLTEVSGQSIQTLCGIMIRETDDADAPFVFIGASSSEIFSIHRGVKGDTCRRVNKQRDRTNQPITFQIRRAEDKFITEYGADGKTLRMLQPPSPFLPPMRNESYLVGLIVCSGDTNKTVTASFDDVELRERE